MPSGHLDQQRPEPALVPAGAGLMADHLRLGVVEALHLQQRRRPAGLVGRPRLPQHQPLAAQRLHAVQFRPQRVQALARLMGVGRGIRRGVPPDEAVQERQPLLEVAAWPGASKTTKRSSFHRSLLSCRRTMLDGALELLAAQPQFAVQRLAPAARPRTSPGRGRGCPAATGTACRPSRRARRPASRSSTSRSGRSRCPRSRPAAAAAPALSSAAAFAGTGAEPPTRASSAASPRSFRRCLQVRRSMADRLVAPGRTGAGVDAADVLEDVRLAAGALHRDRFAVRQIGHGSPRSKRKEVAESGGDCSRCDERLPCS